MKQETTTVYRVENSRGYGPYAGAPDGNVYDPDADLAMKADERYSHYMNGFSFIDSGDDEHPSTSRDPLLAPFFNDYRLSAPYYRLVGDQFRHGFRSIETMLNWFHSCSLDAMLAAGFVVREYELPVQNALHGTYQSIFHPERVIQSRIVSW